MEVTAVEQEVIVAVLSQCICRKNGVHIELLKCSSQRFNVLVMKIEGSLGA